MSTDQKKPNELAQAVINEMRRTADKLAEQQRVVAFQYDRIARALATNDVVGAAGIRRLELVAAVNKANEAAMYLDLLVSLLPMADAMFFAAEAERVATEGSDELIKSEIAEHRRTCRDPQCSIIPRLEKALADRSRPSTSATEVPGGQN